MRGFAHLFRRDLTQRAPLFIASLAMGLFILGLPFLPGSRLSPAELRGAAGLVAALTWCAVLALLMGGSIFTRDLTENRLAFDFRLPVRPSAIWAARLLAAIATIALAAGLVLAPSALAGMDLAAASAGLDVLLGIGEEGIGVPSLTGITIAPLAIIALLLLANPAALATRARQAWAGLDMISFAFVGVAAYWSWQTLRPWEARSAFWWTIAVLIGTTLIGTAVASLLQVARGRTEPDNAQRCLSLGLLTTALLAAGAGTGYSQWLVHPTLNDLVGNTTAGSRSLGPDWVAVEGLARGSLQIPSRFLVAPVTGRVLRLGPVSTRIWSHQTVSSSIDGSTIAWLESDSEARNTLHFLRLSTDATTLSPEATRTSTSDLCVNWVLSPDGSFVAALEMLGDANDPMRLVVSRIESGDVVAAVQFPHCRVFGDMLFANSKEVLIPCGFPSYSDTPSDTVRLVRVDLASKTARPESYIPQFPPSLDGSVGLVQGAHGWLKLVITKTDDRQTGWQLLDHETDRIQATLAPPAEVRSSAWVRGRQVSDGTFALTISQGGRGRLVTYSSRGDLLRTVSLPQGVAMILAESLDSKTVLVSNYTRWPGGVPQQSFLAIDIETGASRSLSFTLRPAGWLGEIGSAHSVLYDGAGRLVWFNPASKLLQPLLGEANYFESGLPKGSSP